MDKQRALVIDRALKQLSDPALEKSKAGRRLQQLLEGARKSGELSVDDLRRGTVDLVDEVDIPKFFAKNADPTEAPVNSALAILFLLIILAILAALVDESSDTAALINDLIQSLLDLLRGA